MNDQNKSDIEKAKSQFNAAVDKLNLHYMQYEGLGKADFKTKKLSPDSMMQLAFQVVEICASALL